MGTHTHPPTLIISGRSDFKLLIPLIKAGAFSNESDTAPLVQSITVPVENKLSSLDHSY